MTTDTTHPDDLATVPDDLPRMVTAATVRAMLGGISEPTLTRWQHRLGMPGPRYVGGRRMWDARAITAWISAQPSELEHRPELDRGREVLHRGIRAGTIRPGRKSRHGGAQ